MIYLASPYSGTREEQIERHFQAMVCCAALFRKGLWVVSPIVHWHEVAHRFNLGSDVMAFKAYCHSLLTVCSSLYILQIDGWDHSVGVANEIQDAKQLGKNIMAVVPNGYKYNIEQF